MLFEFILAAILFPVALLSGRPWRVAGIAVLLLLLAATLLLLVIPFVLLAVAMFVRLAAAALAAALAAQIILWIKGTSDDRAAQDEAP